MISIELVFLRNGLKQLLLYFVSLLPKSFVFGRSYRKAQALNKLYKNSEDKKDFVCRYTKESLSEVFEYASKCEFYKKQNGIDCIEKYSVIDKDVVIDAGDDILVDRKACDLVSTGGTSGKPLSFYINRDGRGAEWFWITQAWSLVGFDWNNSWRAVLRNHSLGGRNCSVNYFLKEICFDNYRLEDDYICYITKKIDSMGIEFVHAYPSAAFLLASYWKKNNCAPLCVRAFLCGSENVFDYQKKLIQDELGIRMFTWYGHSEQLILAHEGSSCENYHSNPLYGYVELIDNDGCPISVPGEFGELVGTGYINRKTIFIRYRTGDYAQYIGESCPDCGHVGLTFSRVKGRWSGDKIYLSNGCYVTTTALNLHENIYSKIDGMQYFQSQVGKLEVRIVPGQFWDDTSEDELLQALKDKVPRFIDISINKVSSLEYSNNRKFSLLIQNIC